MEASRASMRPSLLLVMEPLIGGTLRHLEYLLAHTSPDEFEVHLAVSAERAPAVRERFAAWGAAGFHMHEVAMRRAVCPVRDSVALGRLVALCRRERFDVVHTHSSKAGVLGRLAARLTGARTVHTPHVFAFDRIAPGRCYLAIERLAARWTDRLVVLSDYQLHQVYRYGLLPPERVSKVPNGVDPTLFGGCGRGAARVRLGLDADAGVALFMGRFCLQKGAETALAAAEMLLAGGERFVLAMVGTGPEESGLRRQVERAGLGRSVRFFGPTDEAPLFYAACDVVVAPSRYEGMSYVMLEAKAAGRAIVTTVVSGMEEFVRHGHDGFLIPPDNAEMLADALRGLAARREELDRMGGRGREGMPLAWHAEQTARALQAIYRAEAVAGAQREARRGDETPRRA